MSSSNALRCLLLQVSFLSLAGLGLARPGIDATPPVFVQQPTLLPNPNPEVPLSALVALQADEPVRVMLSYWDGQQRFGPFNAQPTVSATHDSIPVLSVRPSSTYRIFVTIFDAAGNSTTAPAPLVFDTPALPAGFPPLDVTTSIPSGMEPGVTMISPRESRANNSWPNSSLGARSSSQSASKASSTPRRPVGWRPTMI